MQTAELLRTLSQTPGVSGFETHARDVIVTEFKKHTANVRVDKMGNVIARLDGTSQLEPRPRLMLAAHMDEIGLMVTGLEKGFLRFTTIGGFDNRTLPGQSVTVHGTRPLPGVIGIAPPHVAPLGGDRKLIKGTDLFIDVGLTTSELANVVNIGDVVTIEREPISLSGGRFSSKALDDRAGVTAVLLACELLAAQRHEWDVFGVATVQEEIGLYGAETSSFALNPNIAIAIDVYFAGPPGDEPGVTVDIGKGPAISFGPNIHPVVFEQLIAAAKQAEIPHQIVAEPGDSGTDAWAMQIARGGVPTAIVSIPLKYMHTSIELVSIKDVERAARIIAAFALTLSDASMTSLVP